MTKCDICELDFPSCDTHHIQSRSKGGSNDKWNKTELCPNCHRLVHMGDIIIEGKFMTTAGCLVVWRYKDINSFTQSQDPSVHIFNTGANNDE